MDKKEPAAKPLAEFIPAEEYASQATAPTPPKEHEISDWDSVMESIANGGGKTISLPRKGEFSRAKVVEAFADAFELIGGVPRLAVWAHTNPGDFYKLYGKLLPSQNSSALGESNEMVIKHVIPPTELDG